MPKSRSDKKNNMKGTPKKGTSGRRTNRGGEMSDDDSVCGETASVLSSDRGSYDELGDMGNQDLDHEDGGSNSGAAVIQSREALEEKIAEAIDSMCEKSAAVRTNSINTLVSTLSQNFIPELLLNRKETLRDNIERTFKKGQRSDQGLMSTLASLVTIQIGSIDIDSCNEDFALLKPALHNLILDYSAPIPVRVKCCQALCLGSFLAESSLDDVSKLMAILEPLFTTNKLKKEDELRVEEIKENPTASPSKNTPKISKVTASCSLASAAISGWSLLSTLMPRDYLMLRINRWIKILQGLLLQTDLEIRLNAGEALSLLVEMCELAADDEYDSSSSDEEVQQNGVTTNGHGANKVNMKSLIDKLRELSVESHKSRNKKDRRQQRHSFRDYLHAVEDGDGPGFAIKFGFGEVLEIDTWVKKKQYDAICQALGPGINRHLIENTLIRNILELGSPKPLIADTSNGTKTAKNERQYMNAVNFKARSVNRGKSRDQRMAYLTEY